MPPTALSTGPLLRRPRRRRGAVPTRATRRWRRVSPSTRAPRRALVGALLGPFLCPSSRVDELVARAAGDDQPLGLSPRGRRDSPTSIEAMPADDRGRRGWRARRHRGRGTPGSATRRRDRPEPARHGRRRPATSRCRATDFAAEPRPGRGRRLAGGEVPHRWRDRGRLPRRGRARGVPARVRRARPRRSSSPPGCTTRSGTPTPDGLRAARRAQRAGRGATWRWTASRRATSRRCWRSRDAEPLARRRRGPGPTTRHPASAPCSARSAAAASPTRSTTSPRSACSRGRPMTHAGSRSPRARRFPASNLPYGVFVHDDESPRGRRRARRPGPRPRAAGRGGGPRRRPRLRGADAQPVPGAGPAGLVGGARLADRAARPTRPSATSSSST